MKRKAISHSTLGESAAPTPADHEKEKPRIKRGLATCHVGDRPDGKLADRRCEKEDQQAHLHRGGAGAEIFTDGGKCRQIHVDGEGTDGRQQAEHHRDAVEFCRHFWLFRLAGAPGEEQHNPQKDRQAMPERQDADLYIRYEKFLDSFAQIVNQ